jgi:hypothetical protein
MAPATSCFGHKTGPNHVDDCRQDIPGSTKYPQNVKNSILLTAGMISLRTKIGSPFSNDQHSTIRELRVITAQRQSLSHLEFTPPNNSGSGLLR